MKEDRLLDANINRCAEGLRVLEDVARFYFDHDEFSASLRTLRHKIRDLFKDRQATLTGNRDAIQDVGRSISAAGKEDERTELKDMASANFKRVQEAMRSIEEMLKTINCYEAGKKVEMFRFETYTLEQEYLKLFSPRLPEGIYGILGEKFSLGRSNIQVAQLMVNAGIDVIQYREKLTDKTFKQMYEECLVIRQITKDANIPFIINDFSQIAMMVEADGIHQGQDDLPIAELKKKLPNMMIGCSTHSPEQAEKAISDGADYIGVGPVYSTQTKEDVCDAVGLEYLSHVVQTHDIPFVAIGGIKRDNIRNVLAKGARTVCLVTEIISAPNIEERIKQLKEIAGEFL